jgi:hypothetical protein
MSEVESPLDVTSPSFADICDALNRLPAAADAVWAFDGMSGGFKYTDEVPLSFVKSNDSLKDQVITVLRVLWGYRVALVRGEPRGDLQAFWHAVESLAPSWPGFLPERCTDASADVASECLKRAETLSKGLEELDKRCTVAALDSVAH